MLLFDTNKLNINSFERKLKVATDSDSASIYENCGGVPLFVCGEQLNEDVIRSYFLKTSSASIYNADGLHDDKRYTSRFISQVSTGTKIYLIVLSKKTGNAYSQQEFLQNIIDTLYAFQETLRGAEKR